jgi:hypothetical protein
VSFEKLKQKLLSTPRRRLQIATVQYVLPYFALCFSNTVGKSN